MMRSRLILPVLLATVGCQAPMWTKPGATQDEFSRDKYACMQEAQQPASAAHVNRHGGQASSGIATNRDLFTACMNARGYYQQRPGEAQTASSESAQTREAVRRHAQERFTDAKATIQAITEEARASCQKPRFQSLYEKSACEPSSLTLAQLANGERIGDSERAVLLELVQEWKDRAKRVARAYGSVGDKKGREISLLVERSADKTEKNALELYERKITWGEFSRARKEIAANYREDYVRITSGK